MLKPLLSKVLVQCLEYKQSVPYYMITQSLLAYFSSSNFLLSNNLMVFIVDIEKEEKC